MDQVRLITAIVLSIAIFAVWNYLYAPKPLPVQENLKDAKQEQVTSTSQGDTYSPISAKTSDNTSETTEYTKQLPESFKIIETPLYRIKISDRGAVVKSFKFKNYFKSNDKDSEIFDLIDSEADIKTLELNFTDKYLSDTNESTFSCNSDGDLIKADNKTTITYQLITPSGIVLNKDYTFYPDSYIVDIAVSINNNSNDIVGGSYSLSLSSSLPDSKAFSFQGPTAKIGNTVEEIKIKKIKKKDTYTGDIKWIAMQDRYFISILVPSLTALPDDAIMKLMSTDSLVRSSYKSELDTIKPGSSANMKFHYFAGPKKISLLKSSGKLIGNEINLDDAVSFGWFDIIAKPCLYVMNFIYDNVFSNYGVAIIILTIIIKLCFWPLATKSYKSMAEMKKLQPVIAELKEKYKGDSKKMNQEMMNLYKIYKVNPFSGCFPLIVQMPIFIALYRMLYSAVELRHAPFAAWITDLSAPERLFNFGISIPFMEPPIGIPVLTIIMGFTMFLQQKMSPPAGDPAQARIMMLMPLFLMVVFINFSSGLVLYWLVNNVLSIAQQYYINKKLA